MSLCGNQLVINGTLQANKVVLGRIYASINDAANNEGPASGCSPPRGGSSDQTCASEVISYLPEYYLALGLNHDLFKTLLFHSDALSNQPLNF